MHLIFEVEFAKDSLLYYIYFIGTQTSPKFVWTIDKLEPIKTTCESKRINFRDDPKPPNHWTP